MIDVRAIVDHSANIAADVVIGPYTIIGPDVEIGAGTVIGPHVVIRGPTRIGQRNKIFQFASIGEDPQDLKFRGEETWLEIGDENVIREFCTLNRGTLQGGGVTRIGHKNLFMSYVHIAHDCIIANETIFSNNATLAGHVIVEDFVCFGGFAAIGQFLRLGAHSFVCGASVVNKDVPPYIRVSGHYAKPFGLNAVGLSRRGFSEEDMLQLKRAYKSLFRSELGLEASIAQMKTFTAHSDKVQALVDFLEAPSKPGVIR